MNAHEKPALLPMPEHELRRCLMAAGGGLAEGRSGTGRTRAVDLGRLRHAFDRCLPRRARGRGDAHDPHGAGRRQTHRLGGRGQRRER